MKKLLSGITVAFMITGCTKIITAPIHVTGTTVSTTLQEESSI